MHRWGDGLVRITVIRRRPTPRPRARWWPSPHLQDGPRRHPAGGGWRRGEGVRAVGVPDRPVDQDDRRGCGVGRLGVFQRPQRARGHGPPHGPERRPTQGIEARAAGSRAAAWWAATPAARPPCPHRCICKIWSIRARRNPWVLPPLSRDGLSPHVRRNPNDEPFAAL